MAEERMPHHERRKIPAYLYIGLPVLLGVLNIAAMLFHLWDAHSVPKIIGIFFVWATTFMVGIYVGFYVGALSVLVKENKHETLE